MQFFFFLYHHHHLPKMSGEKTPKNSSMVSSYFPNHLAPLHWSHGPNSLASLPTPQTPFHHRRHRHLRAQRFHSAVHIHHNAVHNRHKKLQHASFHLLRMPLHFHLLQEPSHHTVGVSIVALPREEKHGGHVASAWQ